MGKDLKTLGERDGNAILARPWANAFAIIGLAVLCYYFFLAFTYWRASVSTADMRAQTSALSTALRRPTPPEAEAARESLLQQQRLDAVREVFSYPNLDEILARMLASSQAAEVTLLSTEVGEPSPLTAGETLYQGLAVTVTLQGGVSQIDAFVAILHQQLPVATVASFRINSLESVPVAQLQYLVYLSPQPAPKKKGPLNATPTPAPR